MAKSKAELKELVDDYRMERRVLFKEIKALKEQIEDSDDIPTIAYMCGSADGKDNTRHAVEWFLEIWQMVPPTDDDAYDECEKSLIHALNGVAKSVGITRTIRHWSDNH